MRIFIFMSCLLAPLSLSAQNLPPAGYFNGIYELTGRSPGEAGTAILDWVHIEATSDEDDATMVLRACRGGAGHLERNDDPYEGAAPLVGQLGELQLFCRYANDGDNYPRLTCFAVGDDSPKVPGILTLWPAHWEQPKHASECE